MSSLTYNTKLIFSNLIEKQKLVKVLEDQRLVVNECFKIAFDIRKSLNIVTLHSSFYKNFREKYPEIPSQIVIRGESEVLATFKTIKSNKHKIENPPVKTGLSSRLDKRLYTLISRNSMKLTTSNGRITVSFSEYQKLTELLNKYKFCDPLIFVKGEEIFIALTFQIPETIPSSDLALGVDLGIRINAATSEGNLYVDKKFNSEKRKLRFNKRKLQTAKSRRSRSARRHLKKIKRKERNKNKNFCHHLANAILKDTKAGFIILEDLSKIKKKKYKSQNKNRISQIPLFDLRRILTYKAPLFGKLVETVSPAFTSQRDHRTGCLEGKRLGRRFIGKDGLVMDADVNASINIAKKSKYEHPISIGNYLDGQGLVKNPNASVRARQATAL